jgi:hypothetical protein
MQRYNLRKRQARKRQATTAIPSRPPHRGSSRKTRQGLTSSVSAGRTSPVLRLGRPVLPVPLGRTPHIAPGRGIGVPPLSSTGPTGPTRGGVEAARSRQSLSVSTPFPLTYKRKERPRGEIFFRLAAAHAHCTKDLGARSLSRPFVILTANLVQEHKRLKLDVEIFCLNQYKPSYLCCSPSGSDAQS